MAYENYRILFPRSDFLTLAGSVPLPLLTTKLLELSLATPIIEVRAAPNGAVAVEWESLISTQDRLAVQSAIANFAGEPTTSEALIVTAAGPFLAPSSTPVLALRLTSPPLDDGDYQLSWASEHRLTAAASQTASRVTLTVNGVIVQRTHWAEILETAYNGSFPIKRTAGQTIVADLHVSKVGAGPVSAELTRARLAIRRDA